LSYAPKRFCRQASQLPGSVGQYIKEPNDPQEARAPAFHPSSGTPRGYMGRPEGQLQHIPGLRGVFFDFSCKPRDRLLQAQTNLASLTGQRRKRCIPSLARQACVGGYPDWFPRMTGENKGSLPSKRRSV